MGTILYFVRQCIQITGTWVHFTVYMHKDGDIHEQFTCHWSSERVNSTVCISGCSMGVSPMFPGTYVPRDLCSPGPMFPGTYVPRVLCSPDPMFPGSYVGGGGVEHIVANIAIYVGI